MIDYETYCRIRIFHKERGLNASQIGRELGIDPETAAKYAALDTYPRRRSAKRPSKLDAFKPAIIRWLEHHPYSATQIHQRLCAEEGYTGGLSIVKQYVRAVRPRHRPAFLSLAFAPGEAAQVDWGSAGVIQIGSTRRRLSFFVMVLCHSRMAYIEFTCGEATEHFLACHQNALEFFGGTPAAILIDNLKTGVLSHRFGQRAVFNPHYLGYAACQQGMSVLFANAIDVINTLHAAQTKGTLKTELRKYTSPALLILDEIGYLPIDQRGADLLFQVISARYERGSIILTTNKAFKQWPAIFNGDSTI